MSRWAVVENETVTEVYYDLPQNWRNVSNFFALEGDVETLKSFGWYPVDNITKPLSNNQTYGTVTYTLDSTKGIVVQDCSIIDLDPISSDIEFNVRRIAFMQHLRERRNQLLIQSDWSQLQDIVMLRGSQWQIDWMNYRQLLRDLPKTYEDTYPNEVSVENIIWPITPES